MSQDILSDVLRSVRLRGVLYFYISGSRDWVAEAPPSREIAAAVMPDSEHVMEYRDSSIYGLTMARTGSRNSCARQRRNPRTGDRAATRCSNA